MGECEFRKKAATGIYGDLNGRVFFIIVFKSNTGYPWHASSSVNNLTSVAIIVARRDETTRRKCNIRRLVRFVPRRQLPLMEDISFTRLNVMYDSRGHGEFHIYDNAVFISTLKNSNIPVSSSSSIRHGQTSMPTSVSIMLLIYSFTKMYCWILIFAINIRHKFQLFCQFSLTW